MKLIINIFWIFAFSSKKKLLFLHKGNQNIAITKEYIRLFFISFFDVFLSSTRLN